MGAGWERHGMCKLAFRGNLKMCSDESYDSNIAPYLRKRSQRFLLEKQGTTACGGAVEGGGATISPLIK
jgi:hypothetical protein